MRTNLLVISSVDHDLFPKSIPLSLLDGDEVIGYQTIKPKIRQGRFNRVTLVSLRTLSEEKTVIIDSLTKKVR